MKFEQWLTQAKQNQHERIGQQFCNTYVRGSWPELFYADNDKAKTLIIASAIPSLLARHAVPTF